MWLKLKNKAWKDFKENQKDLGDVEATKMT
jgi:hypothetical protein